MPDPPVTAREFEVLRYVSYRLTNREIAGRLGISVRTVESHVSALLVKLAAENRRELGVRGAALVRASAVNNRNGALQPAFGSFIGRSDELARLLAMLDSHRLITLTGPAGVGKTRLAIELAARVATVGTTDVRFADLAAARHDGEVAECLLTALSISPPPGRAALDGLAQNSGDWPVLLIMDNCEQALRAVVTALGTLLGSWPGSRVVATSREPLNLIGEETVFTVQPLTVPAQGVADAPSVVACDAVQLLVDRARSSGATFSVTEKNAEAVARLCRSMDGLPLALELMAGRLRTFTPAQLVTGMRDRLSLLSAHASGRPDRHRTLRGAVDTSFEALSRPERSLFAALSVFTGTFAFDAVEDICGGCIELATAPVMETFARLVDRSLVMTVTAGPVNRYRLLETLRDYAREKLPPGAEPGLRYLHAGHYLALVERAECHLRGRDAAAWIVRLRADQPNLDEALDWSVAYEPQIALRLVNGLRRYWEDTDQRHQGISWSEKALGLSVERSALKAEALMTAAILIAPWDSPRLTELAAEADELARQIGDEQLAARAAVCRGEADAFALAPHETETGRVQRAIEYFTRTGQGWQSANAMRVLALLQAPRDSLQMLAEGRRLFELEGDRLQAANCAYLLASTLARDLGEPQQARGIALDALAVFTELGSEHQQAHARSVLALIDYRSGNAGRASDVAHDCLDVFRRVADQRCFSGMLLFLAEIEHDRQRPDQEMRLLRQTLEIASTGAHGRTVPLALERLAVLFEVQHPLTAITLLAAAQNAGGSAGMSAIFAARLESLRRRTSPAAFRVAWRRGLHAQIGSLGAICDAAVLPMPVPAPVAPAHECPSTASERCPEVLRHIQPSSAGPPLPSQELP